MTRYARRKLLLAPLLAALVAFAGEASAQNGADVIRIRNNHDVAYDGPVQFQTTLADGAYAAAGDSGEGEIRSGVARMVVHLGARSELTLSRAGALAESRIAGGPLSITTAARRLDLGWSGDSLGALELGLVVLPGTSAGPDDVAAAFEPLDIQWQRQRDGSFAGSIERQGYKLDMTLVPYGGGWVDMTTRLTHLARASGPAYVALVRRVTSRSGIDSATMRFNGRVIDGASSPNSWARDFWYTHGVDWISWKSGALSMAAMSGFTPVPSVLRDSVWVEGSHFYVWDKTRQAGNQLYLISEIAGPNPNQKGSAIPYAPIEQGDSLSMTWRLSVAKKATRGWEESQLLVSTGFQSASQDSGISAVELGVPAVSFGTSYFPYSTFTENFDYYRTPGLDRETWWPFSPTMWNNWRSFKPQMQTDLHIIRAMGFEWVRLHHLELLQEMDRAQALAFLDFYTGEARALGLKVLVDTEGPADWVTLIMGRYRDVVRRVEVENEVLIPPTKPASPARWTSLYHAAKAADPDAQVFLTSAGNDDKFERLRALGVPFDRVGLHAYMHSPEWTEALSSHVLGTASYARSIGRFVTLGEFNWKGLTRLSPPARQKAFADVYESMLQPRAIPEVFEFQFQETIGVNPSIARSGVRHYETIALDRRPKPEALELMRLMRKYARPDAPMLEVPVTVGNATLVNGRATASFSIANHTARRLTLRLSALAYDGVGASLASPQQLTLAPRDSAHGSIALRLPAGSRPGTYHFFLKTEYGEKAAYGWGVASNPGVPSFARNPVLGDRVVYPQGFDVVRKLDWSRPLLVAFGPGAPVLEMEMAYQVAFTLQSVTGRQVWLSTTADLPDSLLSKGSLILVGTAATNPLIGDLPSARDAQEKGLVWLASGKNTSSRLVLTGNTPKAVEAASTDFVLRYWLNAKDAGIRITGMEKGAALGNTVRVTNPDPP
jgi:hypothetical protein